VNGEREHTSTAVYESQRVQKPWPLLGAKVARMQLGESALELALCARVLAEAEKHLRQIATDPHAGARVTTAPSQRAKQVGHRGLLVPQDVVSLGAKPFQLDQMPPVGRTQLRRLRERFGGPPGAEELFDLGQSRVPGTLLHLEG